MDAEALGLCAGSFDAVMCGFAIFWFVNQERAIQEAVRVLKPGGQFGLSMGAGTDPRWDWYRALVDEYVKRHKLRTDFGATGYVPLEVLTERLRRAGFGEIQSAVEELEFVYRDADEWWEAQWSHGTRAPLEQMQVEVLEEFREKALKEVRNMHAAGGIFQAWPLQLVVATRL
jgi:ubiquinone/menaquinone biosynthesis C-methylase UbiE